MTTLPAALDFAADPAATPARMNRAMAHIDARFRAVEAIQPDFLAAIEQLRQVGLERLAEALIPIFEDAESIDAYLKGLQDEYSEDTFKAEQAAAVLALVRDGVVTEFDTLAKMATALVAYRSKYLGARDAAPTTDDNGDPVTAGATYFDTVLNRMRVYTGTSWQDAGSAVSGILEQQEFTAAGGETSVAVDGGYDPGNIVVAINGVTLPASDVVTTSGTSIGLPGALTAGDVVSWVKFGAVTLANVFTKTQSDARYYQKAEVYTKTEANTLLGGKANTSTTYTKSEVDAAIAAAVLAAAQPGEIKTFARSTAPTGYLPCNGQVVARTTYAALFNAIGTAFNTGGESGSDFRLPDFRGEFLRGWDNGRGVDAGRVFGSTQADEIKSHVHNVTPPAASGEGGSGFTTTGLGGVEFVAPYQTAAAGGAETRPRNVAVLICIKT
jgi:phage-related tail fiber protein